MGTKPCLISYPKLLGFNSPWISRSLKQVKVCLYLDLLSAAPPVSGCSVMAMLLAGSFLPCLLIKVSQPNGSRLDLREGFPGKQWTKTWGLKAKTIYVAKRREFSSLCVCLYITLGEALSGLGGHSLHYPAIVMAWLKQRKNVYLQHSPGGTWTALKLKEQSRMFLVQLCRK